VDDEKTLSLVEEGGLKTREKGVLAFSLVRGLKIGVGVGALKTLKLEDWVADGKVSLRGLEFWLSEYMVKGEIFVAAGVKTGGCSTGSSSSSMIGSLVGAGVVSLIPNAERGVTKDCPPLELAGVFAFSSLNGRNAAFLVRHVS
jgi:hypothetical protein